MSKTCAFGSPFITRHLQASSRIFSSSFVCQSRSLDCGVFLRKRQRAVSPPTKCTAAPSERVSADSVPVGSEATEKTRAESASLSGLAKTPSVAMFMPAPNTLASALQEMFSEGERERAPEEILRELVAEDVEWRNPLFNTASLDSVAKNLDALLNFVRDPRILIIGERELGENETEIEWIFSFVYPLPWLPRVSIGGRTIVERDSNTIIRISDTWNGPPWYVIRQGMLRFQDLVWLWPSPHAEVDVGIRRLERKTKDYSIFVVPTHPEFRFRAEIKKYERYAIWSTPVLPQHAYAGNIRRLEEYDAVSPIAVRKILGDEFEWGISLPGAFFGRDLKTFEHPDPAGEYVMVPERRVAVLRFRGFATAKLFLMKRDELLEALVRDGVIDEERAGDCTRVWSRLYDCKLGFNRKGMPTLAAYGYSRLLPRVNEIAIELGDKAN